jgi:uncharacterized protein YqhQ
MPTLIDAVKVLAVVLGFCIFIALGAFFSKALSLSTVARASLIIAMIAIILFVIYVAIVAFT